MEKRYFLLFIAIIPLILLGSILPNLQNFDGFNQNKISASTQVSDYHTPDCILNTTVDINVVFVGFEANSSVITTVNDSLNHWTFPSIYQMPDGSYFGYYDAIYYLDINYINAPSQMALDYYTFINSNIGVRLAPDFLVDYDPSMSGLNVGVMDADNAEAWLYQNTQNYSGLETVFDASYTLFFLDSFSSGLIGYYRYYNTSTIDPDTGVEFVEDFMVSWGGNERFYFVDWASGPTLSGNEYGFGEPVNSTTFKPIWDYESEAELCDSIAEIIDESTGLLFLPNYLYEPDYNINHAIQYLFIDATSDDSVLALADSFVNGTVVNSAFTELIPYTNWSANYTAVDVDHPSLTELAVKIKAHPDGYGGYDLLNSSLFTQEYVDSLFGHVVNDPNYVRAVIVVYDELTFIDGTSWGKGLPWGALFIGYRNMISEKNVGLTNLAIHENGHVFGLRHPHDGYDYPDNYTSDDTSLQDWLYDFQPTPMTYLGTLQEHGCQRSYFSKFNHDSVERGHILDLINKTYNNLDEMATILESKGYTTLPTEVQMIVDEIMANLTLCGVEFEKMDYLNLTIGEYDAFSYVYQAWDISDDAVLEAENTIVIHEFSMNLVFLFPIIMVPVYIKRKMM